LSHKLEVGERRSLASHYTLTTTYTVYMLTRVWLCTHAPGRRLPADRGLQTPPASLRSRKRPHCSENKHSTWRFSVAGPRTWNSLPASLRQPDIEFGHFKRLLKAFLFGETAAH